MKCHKADCFIFFSGVGDFSLKEWLQERKKTMEDKFGTSGIDFLLEAFNLTNYLLDEKEKCDGQRHPYSPSVNGWNIGI